MFHVEQFFSWWGCCYLDWFYLRLFLLFYIFFIAENPLSICIFVKHYNGRHIVEILTVYGLNGDQK